MSDSFAVRLRANMPLAEVAFWTRVRRKQILGLRFRRQMNIGPYYADFVCLPARLIIELDGEQHAEQEGWTHDVRRDAFLRAQKFRVLRIWNGEVLHDIEGVLFVVKRAIREQMRELGRPLTEEPEES